MVILYMVFLLPLTIDAYHLAGYGQYCSDPSTRITTKADCIAAAADLGLNWGNSWWGPHDFAGCLYTRDYRKKVYFNRSPYPSSTPNNPNYAEICTGAGQPRYYGLVLTGGHSGSSDADILKSSEIVSYFAGCNKPSLGRPGIPDLPKAMTAGQSVWIKDRLIFCGGCQSTWPINPSVDASNECWSLKPGDTDWSTFNHMMEDREVFTFTPFNHDPPQAIVIGGYSHGDSRNTIEVLTFEENIWKFKLLNLVLNKKTNGHCTVQIGRRVVIVMGGGQALFDPTDTVLEINLNERNPQIKWLRSLPVPLWAPACTKRGGHVYVSGGQLTLLSSSEKVYKYEIATGRWTTLPGSLNTPRYGHAMGTTAAHQMVVAGGYTFNRYLSSVEDYYIDQEDRHENKEEWVLRTQFSLVGPRTFSSMARVPAFEFNCD